MIRNYHENLKKWCRLSHVGKKMALEGLYFLFTARLSLWFIPFKKIAGNLGSHMKETPYIDVPKDRQKKLMVQKTIHRLRTKTPWESTCLVQSMAAKTMLNRRGICCTLYFGMAKNNGQENQWEAHAWLRSGQVLITGATESKSPAFTVVSFFGDVRR